MKQVPLKADEKDIKRWKHAAWHLGITFSSFMRRSADHAIEMQLDLSDKPTYPISMSKVPHPPGPPEPLKKHFEKEKPEAIKPKVEPPQPKKTRSGGMCQHRVPVGVYCKRCQ
jgi:hypothetical protein